MQTGSPENKILLNKLCEQFEDEIKAVKNESFEDHII